MTQSAPQTDPKHRSGWTPERRAAQAEAIRRWSPWAKSTGPRTATGKARSAQNAAKPHRACEKTMMRVANHALREQRRYISEINHLAPLLKKFPQNELLAQRRQRLLDHGHIITAQLVFAATLVKLCKNLAFSPPFPLKVNANDDAKT